jgi:voltage-gated potassium channel
MARSRHSMRLPWKRLKMILLVVLAVILTGTIGYHYIEQLNFLDSLYMTVITLATVGYAEVKPFTPEARIFTIILIMAGVVILTYAVESLIEIVTDPNIAKYFKNIGIDRKVSKMENHYIICGLGRVGSHVAHELSADGALIVCIEKDVKVVELRAEESWVVIEDDATEDAVLYRAGIEKAKGLICTMDSDVNNLYVTISARSIRSDMIIITRVVEDSSIPKFKKAGATLVVSPYTMLGKRIARSVLKPTVDTFTDLALNQPHYDFHLEEIQLQQCTSICGKSIRDSEIKKKTGASIVSIVKEDKTLINNPDPDVVLEFGDTLILIGTSEQLKKVKEEIVTML